MAAAAAAASASSSSPPSLLSSFIDDEIDPSFSASSSPWSRREDKYFELALARHNLDSSQSFPELLQAISNSSGRSLAFLTFHFQSLIEDVRAIEEGLVPLPPYIVAQPHDPVSNNGSSVSKASPTLGKRKGNPWTEAEHNSFLLGLAKFGKGDWRSISRNFVRTRTPTQVASHAQKYYIRLNSMRKEHRRSSIHDISNESRNVCPSPNPNPEHEVKGRRAVSSLGETLGHLTGGVTGSTMQQVLVTSMEFRTGFAPNDTSPNMHGSDPPV